MSSGQTTIYVTKEMYGFYYSILGCYAYRGVRPMISDILNTTVHNYCVSDSNGDSEKQLKELTQEKFVKPLSPEAALNLQETVQNWEPYEYGRNNGVYALSAVLYPETHEILDKFVAMNSPADAGKRQKDKVRHTALRECLSSAALYLVEDCAAGSENENGAPVSLKSDTEKRQIARDALLDPELRCWANRHIAKKVGVSKNLLTRVEREMIAEGVLEPRPDKLKFLTSSGTVGYRDNPRALANSPDIPNDDVPDENTESPPSDECSIAIERVYQKINNKLNRILIAQARLEERIENVSDRVTSLELVPPKQQKGWWSKWIERFEKK